MPKSNQLSIQRIVIAAAMAAAVFITTFVIRIPIPATGGYLNLGDAVIIFASFIFGPFVGAIAGGVGAATADLLGFPIFALPTLIIKAILGLSVGAIGLKAGVARASAAALVGEAWMVMAYFITEAYVFSASMGPAAAWAEVWFNLVQGGVCALIGIGVWATVRQQKKLTTTAEGATE